MTSKKSKSDMSDEQIKEILAEIDPGLELDFMMDANKQKYYFIVKFWQALGEIEKLAKNAGRPIGLFETAEKIETIACKVTEGIASKPADKRDEDHDNKEFCT